MVQGRITIRHQLDDMSRRVMAAPHICWRWWWMTAIWALPCYSRRRPSQYAFRQYHIYQGLAGRAGFRAYSAHSWAGCGELSKRHGAGVDAYQKMGYLPEAMLNYLARLVGHAIRFSL